MIKLDLLHRLYWIAKLFHLDIKDINYNLNLINEIDKNDSFLNIFDFWH